MAGSRGAQSVAKTKTIMLIDGYGLIFRAYHAIDTAMTTATGEQTNAVFGFTRMVLDLLNNQRPDYVIVALEGGKTFRHDTYEAYKGTRSSMPDDLRPQVTRVREIIDAMNIPIIERQGFEADDVIGSLAGPLARSGLEVLVVTGDSDLLQLVQPGVTAVLPGRPRFQDLRMFDTAAVEDRYGFAPAHIPDFKALVGDTSDNIPGVPGIGEKTATALIKAFGTVEAIIDQLGAVTPPRAKNAITENIDQLRLSKRLATIVRDLEIEPDLEHSAVQNFQRDRVIDLFRELEFRSLVGKLPDQGAAAPARGEVADVGPSTRTVVTDQAGLAALAARMRETAIYAFDVETTSTDPLQAELVGLAIAVSPTESAYIPIQHGGDDVEVDLLREVMGPVMTEAAIQGIAHHAKYDEHVLRRAGVPVGNLAFDTMIAAYLLGETSVGLKDLAFSHLGIEMTEITALIGKGKSQLTMNMVPVDQVADYACGDVEATFRLADLFRPRVAEQEQTALFENIEMPLVQVLLEMEEAGIAIDGDYLGELGDELKARMAALDWEMTELAGRPVNVNSPKQLATLLFEELKLPSGRRTKTGFSVDADVLEAVRDQHPIVPLILEYKTLGKLGSTYVDALPQAINPRTGRVHTSYNQTVASTGRLSSTTPNLQNIPIRTEMGRRVRRAFVADRRPEHRMFDDAVLLSADYSQIELRLMAHMSEEPFLIDAFRAGADIHKATAALVSGISPDEVTSDQRRVAKTVNFGVLYGMQAFGLSRDSGMSRADAQAFIDQYWARLPQVKRLFEEILRFGVTHGYVRTEFGRRRATPNLQSANGQHRMTAERVAMNMPLQGTAADIMKIAMIQVADRLNTSGRRARLLLQVHDELVLEVDRPELEAVCELVKSTMEGAADLRVPLVADVSIGPNWEEMSDVA